MPLDPHYQLVPLEVARIRRACGSLAYSEPLPLTLGLHLLLEGWCLHQHVHAHGDIRAQVGVLPQEVQEANQEACLVLSGIMDAPSVVLAVAGPSGLPVLCPALPLLHQVHEGLVGLFEARSRRSRRLYLSALISLEESKHKVGVVFGRVADAAAVDLAEVPPRLPASWVHPLKVLQLLDDGYLLRSSNHASADAEVLGTVGLRRAVPEAAVVAQLAGALWRKLLKLMLLPLLRLILLRHQVIVTTWWQQSLLSKLFLLQLLLVQQLQLLRCQVVFIGLRVPLLDYLRCRWQLPSSRQLLCRLGGSLCLHMQLSLQQRLWSCLLQR
mmetsp:Transcript_36386/g.104814  ORF Transcript_36386/g.104814 Transcript_36386/m.104814 type:complete len:326 (+) Transcript_36386:229-1206(+)